MLALSRYRVPLDEASQFREQAQVALAALTARPGCADGRVARSVDDPTLWVLATSWESIGAYRRALSANDVKLHAVPLMYRAIDEPSAFEDLLSWGPARGLASHDSDLA